MKKLWIFFVLFVLMFSVAYAESGSGSNDSGDDTSTSVNDVPECTVDTDCNSNKVCIDGECERTSDDSSDDSNSSNDDVVECVVDVDCGEGYYCDSKGECEDIKDELDDENETSTELENEVEDESDDSVDSSNSIDRTKWIKECVDDSALRNINDLMMKVKRAEAAGEETKVLELKKDIATLNARIRERAEQCNRLRTLNQGAFVSAAVKYKNGSASEVVEYYKLKLSEISAETDEATRLQMLKELRNNIDTEIKNIMERNREIRSSDMKELVQKIEIRKDKIRADDVEIDSKNRSIITEINGKEVEIEVHDGKVTIKVDGLEVDTSAITVENNTLYYDGVAIKTLPSEALFRYKIQAKEMELEQEGNKLVYKVKYEEHKKLFGLFKAKATREAQIDSEDGNKLSDKGPWWSFLATDDNSAEVEDNTATE